MDGRKYDHLIHNAVGGQVCSVSHWQQSSHIGGHLHQQVQGQSIVHLKRSQSPSKQTVCLPTIWQKAMQQKDQHLQAEELLLPRCYETIKYNITERYSKYVLT